MENDHGPSELALGAAGMFWVAIFLALGAGQCVQAALGSKRVTVSAWWTLAGVLGVATIICVGLGLVFANRCFVERPSRSRYHTSETR